LRCEPCRCQRLSDRCLAARLLRRLGIGVVAIVGGSIYVAATQEPPAPPPPPPEVCDLQKFTPDEYGYGAENFVGGAQS
jgi:hypothetical protein